MTADIHDYAGRLHRAREKLSYLENSGLLLIFHRSFERSWTIGWQARNCLDNSQQYGSSTKEDLKILVRKNWLTMLNIAAAGAIHLDRTNKKQTHLISTSGAT